MVEFSLCLLYHTFYFLVVDFVTVVSEKLSIPEGKFRILEEILVQEI